MLRRRPDRPPWPAQPARAIALEARAQIRFRKRPAGCQQGRKVRQPPNALFSTFFAWQAAREVPPLIEAEPPRRPAVPPTPSGHDAVTAARFLSAVSGNNAIAPTWRKHRQQRSTTIDNDAAGHQGLPTPTAATRHDAGVGYSCLAEPGATFVRFVRSALIALTPGHMIPALPNAARYRTQRVTERSALRNADCRPASRHSANRGNRTGAGSTSSAPSSAAASATSPPSKPPMLHHEDDKPLFASPLMVGHLLIGWARWPGAWRPRAKRRRCSEPWRMRR